MNTWVARDFGDGSSKSHLVLQAYVFLRQENFI